MLMKLPILNSKKLISPLCAKKNIFLGNMSKVYPDQKSISKALKVGGELEEKNFKQFILKKL